MLDPAIKVAAALYEDFKIHHPPFSGGERDAINCLQLYRATHDKKHLDLAKHYLDIRGLESSLNRSRHNQSYKPVLEQREAVGHAVNCATLMVSLADVGVLTGLRDYFDAAHAMWTDAVTRKMYVTGGVGSTGNEGFGEGYVLPNVSAYAETCAVLMFMTLNHRLFLATGDSKYIDVLERGMYNNALSGVSTAGNRFYYVNRLASAGDGRDTRWDRASLECCPPNLVRFLASMPGYIYAQDGHGAHVCQSVCVEPDGFRGRRKAVVARRRQRDAMGRQIDDHCLGKRARARAPQVARSRLGAEPTGAGIALLLCRPIGQTNDTVWSTVAQASATPDRLGYVTLDRVWNSGDTVQIEFPVEVRRVVADSRVKEDRGRVAIERGPMVYCAEWPDCDEGRALDLLLDRDADAHARRRPRRRRVSRRGEHDGAQRRESARGGEAGAIDPVSSLGESWRGTDDGLARRARVRAG